MNWLVVVAGGAAIRMHSSINKIFIKINQKPLLYWTLLPFQKSKNIDKIVISAKPKEHSKIQKIIDKYKFSKVIGLSCSGQLRQDTVFNALKFIKNKVDKNDIVGIHNAANPFITQDEIKSVFQAAKKYKSALLACPSSDTIKIIDQNSFVFQSPNRELCFCAQTPQVARFDILYSSYQKVLKKKLITTDDAQVVELNGFKPKIIACSPENFKITYPKDLILAKEILKVNYNL
ncbi:MAG: 2-C-methyl-D-erythritol 4-phosphate cytidylyltransferase [Candidatus Shapirobacteria bacterium]|nr:2-C-methyl-D-erythritol 4-phosphate cytidylyltransferase [Candidatus Shapirobacteria bacterium]